MSKIIVHNNSDLSDEQLIHRISDVVALGRQSDNGKCYTYVVKFSDKVLVSSEVTKTGTDVFRIWKSE